MSQSRSAAGKIKKYQTIERDFIGMPKCDGRIPVVGAVIDLFETQFGYRGRKYYEKKGRYLVSVITDCLVLCKVTDKEFIEENSYAGQKMESYRISDFKAGILVYNVVSIDGKPIKTEVVL